MFSFHRHWKKKYIFSFFHVFERKNDSKFFSIRIICKKIIDLQISLCFFEVLAKYWRNLQYHWILKVSTEKIKINTLIHFPIIILDTILNFGSFKDILSTITIVAKKNFHFFVLLDFISTFDKSYFKNKKLKEHKLKLKVHNLWTFLPFCNYFNLLFWKNETLHN